jgi:hypothetical protein
MAHPYADVPRRAKSCQLRIFETSYGWLLVVDEPSGSWPAARYDAKQCANCVRNSANATAKVQARRLTDCRRVKNLSFPPILR